MAGDEPRTRPRPRPATQGHAAQAEQVHELRRAMGDGTLHRDGSDDPPPPPSGPPSTRRAASTQAARTGSGEVVRSGGPRRGGVLARVTRRLPTPPSPVGVLGVTGVARIGAKSAWRTAAWARRATLGSATELAREIASGEPLVDIVDDRVEAARSFALRALGLKDPGLLTEQFDQHGRRHHDANGSADRRDTGVDIRALGNHLLALSTEPTSLKPREQHPAYVRILQELAPDEARILRFMALAGPQPSIDVRTKTPFGVGSERIAGGLNMIAEMAGCVYPELNRQYLANLNRLGMLRFSTEQVEDPRRYSFIEAQPEAVDAMAKVKKAATVYRSIYLSLFGQQFCDQCFTLDDGYDAGGWINDVR